jgi:hypothetical protein
MEKVMSSFEYEPLVMSLDLKTSDEEENRRDTNGARPSGTRIAKEPKDLRGGKDSHEKEAAKKILEQVEFVLQEISYQESASATSKIGEKI